MNISKHAIYAYIVDQYVSMNVIWWLRKHNNDVKYMIKTYLILSRQGTVVIHLLLMEIQYSY